MRVPEGYRRQKSAGCEALVRSDLADQPLRLWWSAGRPLEGAAGRGGVTRASVGGVAVVMRDYRRGGALRALLPDLFPSPERAFDELRVLAELRAAGVPVVEPITAIARRRGPLYRLRLVTVLVDGARTLPAFVAAEPTLRRRAVDRAGRVCAAAFEQGLLHRDLHPDNLVARRLGETECEVLLLDLDRARLAGEPVTESQRDAMLVRMGRYLRKHADRLPVRLRAVDELRFLRGLGLDRAARRALWPRLGNQLAAQLSRRGLTD